jgi:hypothetical protein
MSVIETVSSNLQLMLISSPSYMEQLILLTEAKTKSERYSGGGLPVGGRSSNKIVSVADEEFYNCIVSFNIQPCCHWVQFKLLASQNVGGPHIGQTVRSHVCFMTLFHYTSQMQQ